MTKTKKENEIEDYNFGEPPVYIVWIAVAICLVIWVGNFFYGWTLDPTERGVFGDMFGAVNSVFSGLAFIGVIYAILLQRHEVKIAKFEISKTKEIFEAQQRHLEFQNLEMQKQSFENTFFQMLRVFIDLVAAIDLINDNGKISKGKDALLVFSNRLKHGLENGNVPSIAYEKFYAKHSSELGHYFRTLYNIYKFLDHSSIENKRLYSNLVRAQLSDAEAVILFYNGLSEHGKIKFKPLIEKYALLKNFKDETADKKGLKARYKDSAF